MWVDEVCDERDVGGEVHLANVDKLLDIIGASDIYVALLAAPHRGTRIEIEGHESNVTFFEIELFRAALLNKPLLLLRHRDFAPEPDLSALLDLIIPILPRSAVRTDQTNRSIETAIRDLLNGKPLAQLGKARAPLVKRLTQRLFDGRGRFASQAFASHPLLLLNHSFSAARTPNEAVIASALVSEAAQHDAQRRLTRLWIALRELFGAPFWEPRGQPFWHYWNTALGAWGSATSWYGLHAHLWLGPLAGINSLAHLRQIVRRTERTLSDDPAFLHPGGSLASAWYSISKHLLWPWDRWRALSLAKSEINISLQQPHENRANLLATRGSIYRQQLRLWSAVEDYEEVVRLRQSTTVDAGALGEGLAELGFGYLLTLRPKKGLACLKEGDGIGDSVLCPLSVVFSIRPQNAHAIVAGPMVK
jgi:hypothetical protein